MQHNYLNGAAPLKGKYVVGKMVQLLENSEWPISSEDQFKNLKQPAKCISTVVNDDDLDD